MQVVVIQMSSPAAYPFVLTSARDVHVADGLRRIVTLSKLSDLPDRVRHLLADAGTGDRAPRVVVGALPFAADGDAHIFQPERWSRPLPSSGAAHGVWPPLHGSDPRVWSVQAVPTRAAYRKAVATAVQALTTPGADLRKVVLARTLLLHADRPIDAGSVFRRLAVDRAVTTFAVPLPPCEGGSRRVLVGATPELLAARHGRIVSSRPLAGSARRRPVASDDRDAAELLARSEKDLREHAAVVEWIADHLAPYCRRLHVPKSPSLVSTASMWHLGSTIEGDLRDTDVSSLQLALALHPTPAVCGTPYQRASDLIRELEPFERGFYSGAVGWNDASGDGEWHVSIRCAEICGTSARLFAGAGIVRGSDPAQEVAETSGKFVALLRALGVDEDGRSFPGTEL